MSEKLEFRIIRHGPKYPATHPDKSLANSLTEEGRKAAHEYGINVRRQGYQKIHIFNSGVVRAKQTAAYIHAGFEGISSVNAFVDTYLGVVEPELEQMEPESPFIPYYAKLCTRKEAIEKCYAMLRADVDSTIDRKEIEIMQTGTNRYLRMLEQYAMQVHHARKATEQQSELHIFVGHDPNIGGLQQRLQPAAAISELGPLEGIRFRIEAANLLYKFNVGTEIYSGCVKQI